MPAINRGECTFTIRHTLRGMTNVEAYTDADVLYYKFQPTELYPVRDFSLTLSYPNAGSQSDMAAWLHCTAPSYL